MLLLVLLALLVPSVEALAVTRYVAKTSASNTGGCTNPATPCATITYGVSQMGAGDILMVGNGTYVESNINPPSGSAGAPTIIRAQNAKQAIIQPDDCDNVGWFASQGRHHVTFDGMVIDGNKITQGSCNDFADTVPGWTTAEKARKVPWGVTVEEMGHDAGSGCIENTNTNLSFINGEVKNTRQSAFLIAGSNWLIQNSWIHDLGNHDQPCSHFSDCFAGPHHHGLYFSVHDSEASYNRFTGIAAYNFQVFASGCSTVANNRLIGNRLEGSGLGTTYGGTGHLISNNVSIRDGGFFDNVAFIITSGNTKFFNNTVIDRFVNAQGGADNASLQLRNNLVCYSGTAFDMGSGPIRNANRTSCPTGTFFNASVDDYHLTTGSLAINAGEPLPSDVPLDIEQHARPIPVGGAWDQGAYEFGATGTSVATSLDFLQQPSSAQVGVVITPPITVQVLDQSSNPMGTGTQAITLSFQGTPPPGAVLSGTLTQNAVNGVATFTNLSINVVGSYQLKATATLNAVSVQVVSTTFSITAPGTAPNVLRVHVSNPRYFQTAGGPAIILTGSHTWCNLANYFFAGNNETCTLDYPAYLNFLQSRNHNFMRMWRFDLIGMEIHPWARSATACCAADGQNKLDFTVFDEAWFDRLRSRIIAAGQQGIYVSIMLFDGTFSELWWSEHLMNAGNNVQGIDGGGSSTQTETNTAKLTVQENFIKHVIDKVNDLDNVLYEISNESVPASLAWQNRMTDLIHTYEAGKPKQHPVGITAFGTTDWNFSDLLGSTSHAEWTSPGGAGGCPEYRDDPPAATGQKVILTDSDHCGSVESGVPTVVWKNFTRGHQMLLMEEPDLLTNSSKEPARKAAGQTRLWADSVPLAAMTPQNSLASTGYALASAGQAYIVWQPGSGGFTVTLPGTSATYTVTWWRADTQVEVPASNFTGSGVQTFTPPFAGAGALRLVATTVNLSPLALGGPGRPGALAAPVPVVLTHPVLRGLLDWFRVTPPWAGGPRWYSLLSARTGTLTNMGTSTGWHGTRRVGGQGEMAFDGVDDLVSLSPSLGTFTATGQYSWAFWLRPESFAEWQGVFAAVSTPGTEGAGETVLYAHSTTNTDWGPVTQGLSVGFRTAGGNYILVHSTDNVFALSTWAHVLVTYDGSLGAASRTTIYVNGVDVTATGDVTVVGTLGTMTPAVVNLGSDTFGDPLLAGALDDIQVWTRTLSPAVGRDVYRLSQQGWPGVLRRQDDLVVLGPGTPTLPSGRKGAFFPFLQREQPTGR